MVWGASFGATVKELDQKIKRHNRDLEGIQRQIEDLESEKKQLERSEKDLSRTLSAIESRIETSGKKQDRTRRQIQQAERELAGIAKEATLLAGESRQWGEVILSDLRAYHARSVFRQSLKSDPAAAWALRAAIRLKAETLRDAKVREREAVRKKAEWTRTKERYSGLRADLEAEIARQKTSKEEKKKLYDTTQGKRLIAEEEVGRLRDTAQDLERLIVKLQARREKTVAARREAELMKISFEEKLGKLPWPAEGKVVSRFGRRKHPDLDIPVIHNGIEIRAAPNAAVRAVEGGTVVYASDFRSYGQTVILDHGGENYTVYGLLGGIEAEEGGKVRAGDTIGLADSRNVSTIYFEIRNRGKSQDPLRWLKPAPGDEN